MADNEIANCTRIVNSRRIEAAFMLHCKFSNALDKFSSLTHLIVVVAFAFPILAYSKFLLKDEFAKDKRLLKKTETETET